MLDRIRQLLGGGPPPHPLIVRNNYFSDTIDKSRPLSEYDIVVLDTELTGLKRKKDEIVAIGAVKIKNLRILCGETFYALVQPKRRFQTQSTLIHRITPDELARADTLPDILPRFVEFCGDSILVGHYVGLDIGFINKAALAIMGGIIKSPCLDTMRLAMALNEKEHGRYYDHYQGRSSYNLAALTREYRLPVFPEHNALHDALQCAYLFLSLAKKLRGAGALTLADYLKAGRQWKIIY